MSSTRHSTKRCRKRARTNPDGFTLLEVLVAISIFSLVVGMATFSLRHSFGVVRNIDAPFAEQTRRVTGLRDCITSAFPYIGQRSDMFNRNKTFYTCFDGESDRFTFVSGKPLASQGPALCRLFLRDRQLVLQEAPLYGKDVNYLTPSFDLVKERRETVILSDVSALTVDYFQGERRSGTLKEELPTLVRMKLAQNGTELEISCRIQSDFTEKRMLPNALQQPL